MKVNKTKLRREAITSFKIHIFIMVSMRGLGEFMKQEVFDLILLNFLD